MKKLLKSLALVFVVVFGLCAFSACDKEDKKDPEPPTPTNLTNAQVKTALGNFCDKLFANIGNGEEMNILPEQDTAVTSNYSKLGLLDSNFSTLNEETLQGNFIGPLQFLPILAAVKNESEIIGKAFTIGTQPIYNLYVESANTEKIVIQILVPMNVPAVGNEDEPSTSNDCTILELFLNSASTNVIQMVMTNERGTYYSLGFDGDLKFTHFICVEGEEGVDLQNKKVTSVLELNLLAMKGYFKADTQPQATSYEPKTIDSEATGKSIYTALYKTEPTTIEATVSQSFEGKELKPIESNI